MRLAARLVPRSQTWRYAIVAVLAFTVGSATMVEAAPTVMGIFRLADGTDATKLAAVDGSGNLQVKVNNLPTTQAVSGTVSTGTQTQILLNQVMKNGDRATVDVSAYKTVHVDLQLVSGNCFGSGASLIVVEATNFMLRGTIGADAACVSGFTGIALDTPGESLTFIMTAPGTDTWRVTVFARSN